LLVADEGADSLEFAVIPWSFNDLDALDFAALSEKLSKVLFFVVGGKVLDEEIALLLRVLEANLLALNLSLTLVGRDGRLDVELVTVDLLVVKVLDSPDGGITTVSRIALFFKADESKWSLDSVLLAQLAHGDTTLDLTVLREDLSESFFCPRRIEVLHVDVVVALLKFSGIADLIADDLHTVQVSRGHGFSGIFRILEADKAVPVRGSRLESRLGVLLVFLDAERYLCRLDRAKSAHEILVEFLSICDGIKVFDKDVVKLVGSVLVNSEEFSVERKRTALPQ
jgi:hypothetical protein